jgi:hypothetical protein
MRLLCDWRGRQVLRVVEGCHGSISSLVCFMGGDPREPEARVVVVSCDNASKVRLVGWPVALEGSGPALSG